MVKTIVVTTKVQKSYFVSRQAPTTGAETEFLMERFDFVCDLVDTLTDTSFGSPLFDTDDNMRLALEAFGIRFDRKVKVGTILVLDEVNAKDFIPYPYDRPHIGDTVTVIFPGVKVRQSNGSSVLVRKPMVKKV